MKNKYIALSLLLASFAAVGCEDYNDNFEGLQEGTVVYDVKSEEITLTADDYKAIANNKTNKSLAKAKDTNGSTTYADALAAIAKSQCFSELAPASDYLPAFVANLYPTADDKTSIVVCFNQEAEAQKYVSDFTNIGSYTLTDEDYATVWGGKVDAKFLSPSSLGKISNILQGQNAEAKQGDMMVVNYAFSEVEPSIGGGAAAAQPTWKEVEVPAWPEGKNWNYNNSGFMDLSEYAGETINLAFQYIGTEAVAPTVEFRNIDIRRGQYSTVAAFAKDEAGYKQVFKMQAGEYVFAALGSDGNYYPFGKMEDASKGYGYTDAPAIKVEGGIIAQTDGEAYALTVAVAASGNNFSLKNSYAKYLSQNPKADGTFYDNFNFSDTEGAEGFEWTITSLGNGTFAITNVASQKTAKLNYYKGNYTFGCYAAEKDQVAFFDLTDPADNGGFVVNDVALGELSYVWSYDTTKGYGWKGTSNANKANNAAESWVVSPAIALEADKSAFLSFDCAINYLSGAPRADHVKLFVSTDYSALQNKAAAAVKANAAQLYTFDGSAWKAYRNNDCIVDVVTPDVYSQLGSNYIAQPELLLPQYISRKYSYAETGSRFAVVFLAKNGYAMQEVIVSDFYYESESGKKAEKLTIARENGIWEADLSTFYACTFLGKTGDFAPVDIELNGLSGVWSCEPSYGWKGTAYSGKNYAVNSYLVSPVIDLRKAKSPVMTFDEAINYLNGGDANTMLKLFVSTEYTGDPTSTKWTELQIPVRAAGAGWDYVNIGEIDLSQFIGSKIVIAFQMLTDGSISPTWEFKNMSITKKE